MKWDEETWLRLGTNLNEHYQLYVRRAVLSPVAWSVDLQPVSLTLPCQLISSIKHHDAGLKQVKSNYKRERGPLAALES